MRIGPIRAARLAALIFLVALRPTPTAGEAARMIGDLRSISDYSIGGTLQRTLGATESHFFFLVGGPSHEIALWASDGTAENTVPILTPCESGGCRSAPQRLGETASHAFFVVQDETTNRYQIYASDGTTAGTTEVGQAADLTILSDFYDPGPFAAILGDRLYFFAVDSGAYGTYSSDGSPGDLELVRQMGSPAGIVSTDHQVIVFERGSIEHFVWRTDGTPAGTTASAVVPGLSSPYRLTRAEDLVYFAGESPSGEELWRSDGTAGGTFPLSSLPDPFPEIGLIHTLGIRAAAVVDDNSLGTEIFVSDGSVAGSRVATAHGFQFAFDVFEEGYALAMTPSGVLALANNGLGAEELFSIPYAPGEAQRLGETCAAPCQGGGWIAATGPRAVFRSDGSQGSEPWVTDGTASGTRPLVDVCEGTCGSFPYLIVADGQRLIFGAQFSDRNIWSSDGTEANTHSLDDPLTGAPGSSGNAAGNRWSEIPRGVAFPAYDEAHGSEIWLTDLTAGSASLLVDLSTAVPPQGREHVAGSGGRSVFIAAADSPSGLGLWRTSSPTSDASEVDGDYPVGYLGLSETDQLFDVGERVVFAPSPLLSLSAVDADGTWTNLAETAAQSLLGNPVSIQGELIFLVRDSDHVKVWTTDGTPPGTALRASFSDTVGLFGGPFAVGSTALGFRYGPDGIELSAFGPSLNTLTQLATLPDGANQPSLVQPSGSPYGFYSSNVFAVTELWRTDGTPGGTFRLAERADWSFLMGAIHHAGSYFLVTGSQTAGRAKLWRSDGTVAGTVESVDLPPGDPHRLIPMVSIGDRFVFPHASYAGNDLWVSDGTPSGTYALAEMDDGGSGSWSDFVASVPGGAVFAGRDPEHGAELWFTDGTPAGTRRLHDIHPGPGSSWPSAFHLSGNAVYFFADDGVHGREPWVLDLSGAPACLDGANTVCLGGGRFRAEARWRAFDGRVDNGVATSLTPDTGTFWFFDDANIELILKVIDGQGFNGHHWVFYGALSNVEYTFTVTDTETGATKRYFNPAGRFASAGDITAFGPLGAHAAGPVDESSRRAGTSPERSELAPFSGLAASGTCAPSSTRFCILQNRFAVEATWRDFAGHTGVANTGSLTDDTGYLWFFDQANIEVVLKAVDGGDFNDHFWIYYGALSNVEYTITVTDTVAGTHRTYRNPLGAFGSFGDIEAFPAD